MVFRNINVLIFVWCFCTLLKTLYSKIDKNYTNGVASIYISDKSLDHSIYNLSKLSSKSTVTSTCNNYKRINNYHTICSVF